MISTDKDLQRALIIIDTVFKKFGLHINTNKTKTMIFNFKYIENDTSQYPSSIAELNNQPIENVTSFRYLGDIIKFDEPSTGDAELDLRISLAEAKFYELIKKLTNRKIYLRTRVLILNTIVRSRLTYSCHTWNLNDAQMNKINSSYINLLRNLINNGHKRVKQTVDESNIEIPDYRYVLTNKNILRTCNTDSRPIT